MLGRWPVKLKQAGIKFPIIRPDGMLLIDIFKASRCSFLPGNRLFVGDVSVDTKTLNSALLWSYIN